MILYPAQKFDLNEWFILISFVLSWGVCLWLPARFPRAVVVLVLLFSLSVGNLADRILAPPPLDLYNTNDVEKFEWIDLITYGLYPPFGYVFIYFYDKWKLKNQQITLYIIGWSVFAVLFEWICSLAGIFDYKTWKIAYSFPTYLLTQSATLWFYVAVRRRYGKLVPESRH